MTGVGRELEALTADELAELCDSLRSGQTLPLECVGDGDRLRAISEEDELWLARVDDVATRA